MIGDDKRNAGWSLRLNQQIAKLKNTAFEYGVFDCTQFVILCDKSIYGRTHFPEFDCTYKTKLQGLSILTNSGFKSIWGAVGQRMQEINIAHARRGDWVGHVTTDGESLGVFAGVTGFYSARNDSGVMLCSPNDIVKVWRRG